MIFRDICEIYDLLLVDVFGVIWNGVNWIEGALEALEYCMLNRKNVIIISNASVPAKNMLIKYAALGLHRWKHFSEFITSGEVLNDILQKHSLRFQSVHFPETYTILGNKKCHNFDNTLYQYTSSLDDADFVYVSIPQFTDEHKLSLPENLQKFLRISNMGAPGEIVWDCLSIEPFIPQIKEIFSKKKPLLVANPDKFASVGVLNSPEDKHFVKKLVIRQGSIGEKYIEMGGETLFVGKPYQEIFNFALHAAAKHLNVPFPKLKDFKIAMIGDTLETDILGAKNASKALGVQIDSILTKTGISFKEMTEANMHDSVFSVKDYCSDRQIMPDHVVDALALDGRVLF